MKPWPGQARLGHSEPAATPASPRGHSDSLSLSLSLIIVDPYSQIVMTIMDLICSDLPRKNDENATFSIFRRIVVPHLGDFAGIS